MSRIEKALEKATQMRIEGMATVKEQKHNRVASQPSKWTTSRIVSVDIANRLLPTINEPNSVVSEQYRKLKSGLVRITSGETFHNLLMVTSAIAGEGKSLTAANLAVSIAYEFDLTVLLIDADLRRPTIHRLLGFEPDVGISDCLLDGTDLADVIIRTNIDKLSIIPAGREVANPLELFTSKTMQDLMAEIKHRYNDRYIIIDTPPLLPFAESRTLAHLVDGVVLVVREGVTPQDSIIDAKELLKGCPILGVVLNDSTSVDDEASNYSTYYYKSYKTQEKRADR